MKGRDTPKRPLKKAELTKSWSDGLLQPCMLSPEKIASHAWYCGLWNLMIFSPCELDELLLIILAAQFLLVSLRLCRCVLV